MNFTLKNESNDRAILTAIANGEREFSQYEIDMFGHDGNMFTVTRKSDWNRSYFVDLARELCNCRQFEEVGICKHQYMVHEHLRLIEMETEHETNTTDLYIGQPDPKF